MLGVFSPTLRDTNQATGAFLALTRDLKRVVKFLPSEIVRSFDFLAPANGETDWRIVIGTSHRLLSTPPAMAMTFGAIKRS